MRLALQEHGGLGIRRDELEEGFAVIVRNDLVVRGVGHQHGKRGRQGGDPVLVLELVDRLQERARQARDGGVEHWKLRAQGLERSPKLVLVVVVHDGLDGGQKWRLEDEAGEPSVTFAGRAGGDGGSGLDGQGRAEGVPVQKNRHVPPRMREEPRGGRHGVRCQCLLRRHAPRAAVHRAVARVLHSPNLAPNLALKVSQSLRGAHQVLVVPVKVQQVASEFCAFRGFRLALPAADQQHRIASAAVTLFPDVHRIPAQPHQLC
mmetsp:Transcript_6481/g.19546  ORF Transcript_6481/g.19546 Transcript_6481/m.19546 type:complete len:262 (+) Transcript_6481:342-1127(+)